MSLTPNSTPTKIQIFGHSFVRRLKSFLADSEGLCKNFDLNVPVDVRFSGFPGATAVTLLSNIGQVKHFRPDIVVVLVGTCDLSNADISTTSVVTQIKDLCKALIGCGVKHVVVMQILNRQFYTKSKHPVDIPWFNARVLEINNMLTSTLTQECARCIFWKMKGFWSAECQQSAFCVDGVHLSQSGNFKLYRNIRSALIFALECATRLIFFWNFLIIWGKGASTFSCIPDRLTHICCHRLSFCPRIVLLVSL